MGRRAATRSAPTVGLARSLRPHSGVLGPPAVRAGLAGIPHVHPRVSVSVEFRRAHDLVARYRGRKHRPGRALDRRVTRAHGRMSDASSDVDDVGHRANRVSIEPGGADFLGGESVDPARAPATPHLARVFGALFQRRTWAVAGVLPRHIPAARVQLARHETEPRVRPRAELYRQRRPAHRAAARIERHAWRCRNLGRDCGTPRVRFCDAIGDADEDPSVLPRRIPFPSPSCISPRYGRCS